MVSVVIDILLCISLLLYVVYSQKLIKKLEEQNELLYPCVRFVVSVLDAANKSYKENSEGIKQDGNRE